LNKNDDSRVSRGHLHPRIGNQAARYRKSIPPVEELTARLLDGDRSALSRAITLVESTLPEHQAAGAEIVRRILPYTGRSFRIGITGVPGAGKSTFIDGLGTAYVRRGHRVAVLAVDPSGVRNKGSILGDKTRMTRLAKSDAAFIRPSPSGNRPGGVARKTRETILLCEAAGFDRIVVETVGVGQSEIYVHSMTDLFVLLKLPGAGDELQGIKRGIMEMADMILINKADGDLLDEARRAAGFFRNALQWFGSARQVPVTALSSLDPTQIEDVVNRMEEIYRRLKTSGELKQRRDRQQIFWFDETFRDKLDLFLNGDSRLRHIRQSLKEKIISGKITPFDAAETFWNAFIESLASSRKGR